MFIRSRIAIAASVAVAALAVATPASALLVQPIVINLETSGEHSNAAITITNDRNRPDTVEVTVQKLTLPQSGAPVLTPDKGDDFLIFPPTVTVQPGKTQVIRIRWVGDPALAESRIYMFSTTELPVNQMKGSGVQLVYSIQSLVTVSAPGLRSSVSVQSATRSTENQPAAKDHPATSTRGVMVTFRNDGNGIDYVTHYRVKFAAGSWSKTLDTPDVNQAIGLGLLSPHCKRDLFFPLPDVPATGAITVSLEEALGR